ncbi:unnamed protein product, partial [marine sediment metagenome]
KEGIGLGDVKMAMLIGLVTGSGLVLVTLTLGAILGGQEDVNNQHYCYRRIDYFV